MGSSILTNGIGLASILIAFTTLLYLIQYVKATKIIATQSVNQVEATFRPAVVVQVSGEMDAAPVLRNVGNGPAIELRWAIPNTTFAGVISWLEAGHSAPRLPTVGMKLFYEVGAREATTPTIECTYTSLSGRHYKSSSAFELERNEFSTTFLDS